MPEKGIAVATHRHEPQTVPGFQHAIGCHNAAERRIEDRLGEHAVRAATQLENHEASEVVDRRVVPEPEAAFTRASTSSILAICASE